MNKLGQYHDDDRGHYSFNFSSDDGKHITVSFRAEPDYDLDVVFSEFKNFLIASGHDVEGDIGELNVDDGSYDEDEDEDELTQNLTQDKFSMNAIPNNAWPFSNQFPTMSPLAQEQIQSWTLPSLDIKALTSADIVSWSSPMPGTIGGAKVSFK